MCFLFDVGELIVMIFVYDSIWVHLVLMDPMLL